jgi:dTDP-4-amino-4,6-dideoxygalactose transaminase
MKEISRERERIAKNYSDGITNPLVILPKVSEKATSVWHQYVLRVPGRRDEFKEYLAQNGISTIIHYPIPLHLSKAYDYLNMGEGSLPITEKYANEVISLPMYDGMTEEEQEWVTKHINGFEITV